MSCEDNDDSHTVPTAKTLSKRKEKTRQKQLKKLDKTKTFKFNEGKIRANFETEDEFITSLLMFLPRNQQSESLLGDQTQKKADTDGKLSHMREQKPELFGSETRVKNYEELRERIQQKLQKFKKSNKKGGLTKEERMEERRLKKKADITRRKEMKLKKQTHAKVDVNGSAEHKEGKIAGKKEGKTVFSKFDFNEKLEWKNESKKKDKQQQLKQLEENKVKVAELKKKGEHKQVVEEAAWQKAMNLSEGKKVIDDPELIKKSMKKRKHKREKSIKEWDNRVKQQELTKEKAQEKRNKNIKYRKDEKKARLAKKLVKHGRMVPGF